MTDRLNLETIKVWRERVHVFFHNLRTRIWSRGRAKYTPPATGFIVEPPKPVRKKRKPRDPNAKKPRRAPEYKRALKYKWLLTALQNAPDESHDIGRPPTDSARNDFGFAKYMAKKKDFDGAQLLYSDGDDDDNDVDLYFSNVEWRDLPNHDFDVKFVMDRTKYKKNDDDGADFAFGRVRRARMHELRGMQLRSERVVRLFFGGLYNGKWASCARYFECLGDGGWGRLRDSSEYGLPNPTAAWAYTRTFIPRNERLSSEDEDVRALTMALSVAFSQHYQWRIEFRLPKVGAIQVAVHPQAIKNLFRLRDKIKDRRTALKHLVRGHWRTINRKIQFDIQTFVRRYLRGELAFDWFDLKCRIVVPQTVLDDIEKAKREREAMRVEVPRTDRRKVMAASA